MKAKSVVIALFALVLVFSASHTANAWGPSTHVSITDNTLAELKDEGATSPILKTVRGNMDAFYCGLESPDIGVVYYYTQFEKYQSTHNWAFLNRLLELADTPEERAFAYGVAIHLCEDAVVHNEYIPGKLKETLGPNMVAHPLIEASVEDRHFTIKTSGTMEPIDNYIPLLNEALGENVSGVCHTFKGIIRSGSFYGRGYNPAKVGWMWKAYKGLVSVSVRTIGTDDAGPYIDRSKDAAKSFFLTGSHPAMDPAGTKKLTAADRWVKIVQGILAFSITLAIILISYYIKKGRIPSPSAWLKKRIT